MRFHRTAALAGLLVVAAPLALLAEGYARFFYHYAAAPVLIVNSENLNFVERDADFDLLVSRMRAMKSRREYFNLA